MTTIYFHEGDTEKKLIKALKDNNLINPGKTMKFNFWEKSSFKLLPLIKKRQTIYIVFDTDTTDNKQLFIKNILTLKKNCKKLILLSQKYNLEDEIAHSCNCNNKNNMCFKFYKTSSISEFKKKFLKESNIIQKLNNNDFNIHLLWSRSDVISNQLSKLSTLPNGIKHCLIH